MTIADIHGSRASRAGSCFEAQSTFGLAGKRLSATKLRFQGIFMPRGRSTFTKRQKEHTRQQKQRDKAERRSLRRQEGAAGNVDDMDELRKHAAEQAALFNVGTEDADTEHSTSSDHVNQ